MARGRMISATLGRSDKWNALPSDRARLLYVLALTHTDKAGRIEANPGNLRADCFPQTDIPIADIEEDLRALAHVGLITLYQANGKRYAEFTDFFDHNKPHHREPDSKIPPPPEGGSGDGDGNPEARPKQAASTPEACPKHAPSKPIREEKGKGREEKGKGREGEDPDRLTPEERTLARFTTGRDPLHDEHAFRDRLRRHAGAEYARQHASDIPRWSREHTLDALDRLWEQSDPRHWTGTVRAAKRRAWNLTDLLNQELPPPADSSPPAFDFERLIEAAKDGNVEAFDDLN